MYLAMTVMFIGIGVGYFLRQQKALFSFASNMNMYIIYLLLFAMGLSVGANDTIMSNLGVLGLRAMLIGVGATLGSAALSYFVYQRWFKTPRS